MVNIIKKLDNKGVTLIEIITSMSLLFIILPLILVFYSTGMKSCDSSYNISEIQTQGQNIMSFMGARVMTSSEIIMIKDYKGLSCYESDKEIELGELKLKDKLLENELIEEKGMHIFTIQNDLEMEGNSIRYGNNKVAKAEAGNYIKSINVKPLPDGKTYKDARGISFTIIMQKGKTNIEIFKDIYFRN